MAIVDYYEFTQRALYDHTENVERNQTGRWAHLGLLVLLHTKNAGARPSPCGASVQELRGDHDFPLQIGHICSAGVALRSDCGRSDVRVRR
jgi:hypothetical protein